MYELIDEKNVSWGTFKSLNNAVRIRTLYRKTYPLLNRNYVIKEMT